MEIREAILKAADSIESNPEWFKFSEIGIPDGCGTPGCALGWIGAHMGLKPASYGFIEVTKTMGLAPEVFLEISTPGAEYAFYNRMSILAGGDKSFDSFYLWSSSAKTCAQTLRAYADKYHPNIPKTEDRVPNKGIPDNVLSIFREDIAA